jgi:hypothetical protein
MIIYTYIYIYTEHVSNSGTVLRRLGEEGKEKRMIESEY